MELKSEVMNPLFKRQRLVFETDKNLSFNDARKEIAKKIGKSEDLIDVYNVYSKFGRSSFEIHAKVYENKEDLDTMKNMELSKKKKKEIEDARVKAEEDRKKAEDEIKVAKLEDSEETSSDGS